MGELVNRLIDKTKHFVKSAKKAWRKVKYLDRTQLNYYIVTGFIGVFCVFTGGTYAAFTVTSYATIGNITTAKLSYELTIDSCKYGTNYEQNCTYDNNTGDAFIAVSVPANTIVHVDMTITSRNSSYASYTTRLFDTRYAVNYSKVNTGITEYIPADNITVYYSENNKYNISGLIGPNGSSITPIRVVIENNNDSNQTVYLTSLGGYTQNTITSNITEGYYEKDLTLRTTILDYDFSIYSTSPTASFPESTASTSYSYYRTECSEENTTVSWDNDEWELTVNSATPTTCEVYFKKMCNGSNVCDDIEIIYHTKDKLGDESVSYTSPNDTYTYIGYTCNNEATLTTPTWNTTTSKWDISINNVGGTTLCTAYFEQLNEPNPPKLVDNLIPVLYDEETGKWIMSTTEKGHWYDYDNQKWANAVTVKEAKRGTYSVGDTIEMDDILGMWVWIPRYEYKYTNLGTSYAGGTQAQPGAIDIKFISGTSTVEDTGYIIHPAFRNGSMTYTNNAGTFNAWQLGGWDSEITGFWIGKFETSSVTKAGNTTTSIDADPIVKPNVKSRRNQKVAHQYETILGLDTYHGITLDSHMSKNSEWGAVAYLSQSKYGKYGNNDYSGANKEIYLNNSNSFYTGRSMGMPSGTEGSEFNSAGTYEYNIEQSGTGASTTGTIYGVYDMVGGAYDRQMTWLNTASATWGSTSSSNGAGFSAAPSNHRYYEEYTTTTITTACGGKRCYGHGLSETRYWYNSFVTMVTVDKPWILRGAYPEAATPTTSAGIFTSSYSGGPTYQYAAARAILT